MTVNLHDMMVVVLWVLVLWTWLADFGGICVVTCNLNDLIVYGPCSITQSCCYHCRDSGLFNLSVVVFVGCVTMTDVRSTAVQWTNR